MSRLSVSPQPPAALDADLTAIGALASAADQLPYATGVNAWAITTLTAFIRTLLDDTTAAAARTTLGLGTAATTASTAYDASGLAAAAQAASQPVDPDLTAIAALVSAADQVPYATGSGAWALATLTAFARTLLDDIDAAAMRATLGLGTAAVTAATAYATAAQGTTADAAVPKATLTIDGDILTRAAGVVARATRAGMAADVAWSALYAPISLGTVAAQNLTGSFSTVSAHNAYQDNGMTLTFTPVAGRRYLFTIVVNPYVPGGAQDVYYELLAGATVLRDWLIGGLSTAAEHAHTLQYSAIVGALGSTIFKVKIKGTANTAVIDYGGPAEPRQFLIEDIGAI